MPNKYTQPPRQNKNAAASPNLPVKTFRLGRIKAAVWENEGDQKFYSVTFARTYMDEANKYHDTDSFCRDDIPLRYNRLKPKRTNTFGVHFRSQDFTGGAFRDFRNTLSFPTLYKTKNPTRTSRE
jgi:hypothetical protein